MIKNFEDLKGQVYRVNLNTGQIFFKKHLVGEIASKVPKNTEVLVFRHNFLYQEFQLYLAEDKK